MTLTDAFECSGFHGLRGQMRGKPIDAVTVDDLNLLIADGVAEDRRLEFKVDVPVSSEAQKAYTKTGAPGRAVDRSWTQSKSLADFGRDALAEEVVAFANADGGTLVLGMDETSDPPPRAKSINALPDVAGLERRLKDILASCVEPRLPYVAVRGIPTETDGSGVVLIETSGSVLGPHWVRKTRKPTIRRDDRCDPLTMPELHDMVLRNARGQETTQKQIDNIQSNFAGEFSSYLFQNKPGNFIGYGPEQAAQWLRECGNSALGAQVIVMPHYDLGLPRLENLHGLMPADNAMQLEINSTPRQIYYISAYTNTDQIARRVLNGMLSIEPGGFTKKVRVMRSGIVTVSFMQIRETAKCTCFADLVVGMTAFALGLYDRLRAMSNYPAAPASVEMSVCTRADVGVGGYEGIGFRSAYGKLDEHLKFPSYTLGDSSDISLILEEIAADLMNAGGMPASQLPKPLWNDPH